MADLDDFFAKKDKKKKGKKGSKYAKANTDVLAQNLIENEKKEETAEKKAAVPLATSEANKAGAINSDNPAVEEEWKDYEEDKKDFSNLKIETLKVETESDLDDEDEHEINEETGEKVRIKKSDSAGPWNKVASSGAKDEEASLEKCNEQKKAPPKKEEDSSARSTANVKTSYVPPHLRGSGSSGGDTDRRGGSGGRMNRGKNAPDLNAVNFPSLSDATGPKDGSKGTPRDSEERDFETARGGGNQPHRLVEAPKLALDNKFSALRN